MATADDYNRLIGDHHNPLIQGTDRAIAEVNDRFIARMAEAEFARAEAANADRWAAILQAEALVGVHGVVMPIAVAKKMLIALQGGDSAPLSTEMLASMLAGYIAKQEG